MQSLYENRIPEHEAAAAEAQAHHTETEAVVSQSQQYSVYSSDVYEYEYSRR